MKRIPLWPIHALAGLCLALSLAAAFIAVKGIWVEYRVGWNIRGRAWALAAEYGRMSVCTFRPDGSPFYAWIGPAENPFSFDASQAWPDAPWELDAPGPITAEHVFAGFALARGWAVYDWTPARRMFHLIVIPSWLPPVLLGLLPAWWFPRRIRAWIGHRRTRSGRCSACGYDMRGTPDRCPECGKAVEI
jgi:hypothetical protein